MLVEQPTAVACQSIKGSDMAGVRGQAGCIHGCGCTLATPVARGSSYGRSAGVEPSVGVSGKKVGEMGKKKSVTAGVEAPKRKFPAGESNPVRGCERAES